MIVLMGQGELYQYYVEQHGDGYWVRKWNSDSQGVYCETYEDAEALYNRLTWGD